MEAATISAFPFDRQQRLIKEIASGIQSRHGEEANMFWRRTAQKLCKMRMGQGFDQETVHMEIRSFFDAVAYEIHQSKALMTRPTDASA